ALRVLHRALEGLRFGVPPNLISEARVGEMVEALWDNRQEAADPLTVRVFVEALRVLRRAPHAEAALAGEGPEQEAFGWQVARLAWSAHPRVGPFLREWVLGRLPMVRRAQARRRTVPPRRPSTPPDLPYRAILRALRGHPSPQTEAFLLLAARDWDPAVRVSA